MTKKLKTWLIIIVSLLVIAGTGLTLFFVVFNKTEQLIKLETPTLTLQTYENEKVLVCTFDPNASDYAFYIYSDGDYPNRKYDYIEYRASEQTLEDQKIQSYLDVTDIFVEPKDYYFYCKVIGSDKYVNSDETAIQKFSNKYKLSVPQTLSLNGKTLSWRGVSNASSYEIYEVSNYSVVATTTDTTYDISTYIDVRHQTTFEFYVLAVGEGNYENSEKSNTVSYSKSFTLAKVSGLSFNKTNNLLSWNNVANASGYEITINGTTTLTSTTSSINLSEYVLDVGDYTFKVKAIGHDEYADGEYSDVLRTQKTKRLDAVSNITCTKLETENLILISWDSPNEAQTLKITIDGQVYNESFSNENIFLPLGDRTTITIEIVVNGYNYYTNSSTVSQTFTF